jgi:hypothetical protein
MFMNQDQTAHRRPEPTGIDEPYTFGRPASTYLAPREMARLTILRSKVREARLQLAAAPATEAEPTAE